MKVVFSPHAYAPSIGGAERYAQGLAEGLVERGHEVHVLVGAVDDPEAFYELHHRASGPAEETIGGVEIHRVPYIGFDYRLMGRLRGAERVLRSSTERFRSRLGDRLATLAPDVVVALPHLFPNVAEVVRRRAGAPWKLVYAPMLHEDDPYWSVDQVSRAIGKSDGVIALTDHERARLLKSYGAVADRVAVIPPGVGFSEENGEERDSMVLFVGRRTASKRLDVLYKAMQTVWEDHPGVLLVLAGAPPGVGIDPAIWMAGDPRVKVIDRPSEPEKDRLLGQASVVVSPSLTESFGITTLEAWAQGTPVVVTNSPVNRSVVRHGEDGVVASGHEPDDLAVALSRLLGSPDLARRMGEAGRERVRAEFNWSGSAAALDELMLRI